MTIENRFGILIIMGKEIVAFKPEFIEECKAIITESVFTSRWALVEGYWLLGERVSQEKYAKGNESSLQGLAKNLSISTRTLYYAIQAYQKYPKLDTIPEGKNISWNKLITKYLPSKDKEPKHKELICPHCGLNVFEVKE